MGMGVVLLIARSSFYRHAHRKNSSSPSPCLAVSLALWAVLLVFGELQNPFSRSRHVLGTAGLILRPHSRQMLLGVAMVMVLFENERNAVQENALAFSTLGVDPRRAALGRRPGPSMQNILDRLVAPLPTGRAVICISERWRPFCLPCSADSPLSSLEDWRKGRRGIHLRACLPPRRIRQLPQCGGDRRNPAGLPGAKFETVPQVLAAENIRHVTAVSLQTREHNFGVIFSPHAERALWLVEFAPAHRTRAADRANAGKLRRHARRPAAYQGIRTTDPDRPGD